MDTWIHGIKWRTHKYHIPPPAKYTGLWQRSNGNTVELRVCFQQIVLGKKSIAPFQQINLDIDFTHFTKINRINHRSKCKTQNCQPPRKLYKWKLRWLWYDNDFLDATPKEQFIKKIDKLYFIKIKNFCSVKNNFKGIRRQAIDQEKIFAKDSSDNGLLLKIFK